MNSMWVSGTGSFDGCIRVNDTNRAFDYAWTPDMHRFCYRTQREYVKMFYLCHRYTRGDSLGAKVVRRGFSKDLVRLVLELMPVLQTIFFNRSPVDVFDDRDDREFLKRRLFDSYFSLH